MSFEYIVWLEIHTKLSTKHKIFCYCENSQDFDNTTPNTHICPTCTAQPGALPIINPECVATAIRLWHIFNAELNKNFKWDRKSYFYPDSPVGFQITQYQEPIIKWGKLQFFSKDFQTEYNIAIHEAHLENDTAKTITIDGTTYIDFNRCGWPLIEIVTKPEFSNDDQVVEFLKELQRIIRWNNIGFADLEKGQMRVDVNLSVRPTWSNELWVRTETKNLNSFASIRKAIAYEFARHVQLINNGQKVDQETRGRDDLKGETYSLRSKEQAHDYRYFTEADLPQINPETINRNAPDVIISWYNRIKELKEEWFSKEYIYGLLNNEFLLGWFDALSNNYEEKLNGIDKKTRAKRLLGQIASAYNEGGEKALEHIHLGDFVRFLQEVKKWSYTETKLKEILADAIESKWWNYPETTGASFSEEQINTFIETIVSENSKAVDDYRNWKEAIIWFLVGKLMKLTNGEYQANDLKALWEKKLKQ